MNNPYNRVKCPVCGGKGIVTIPCHYPDDVEPDCDDCENLGKCGTDYYCQGCDGEGYVSEREKELIIKEIER